MTHVRLESQSAAIVRDDLLLLHGAGLLKVPAKARAKGQDAGRLKSDRWSFASLEGRGTVVVDATITQSEIVLLMGSDVLYVDGQYLACFSGDLHTECGRMPGSSGPDMVRLSGAGPVALSCASIVSWEVDPGEPTIVSTGRLIGWRGDVELCATSAGNYRCGGTGTVFLRSR